MPYLAYLLKQERGPEKRAEGHAKANGSTVLVLIEEAIKLGVELQRVGKGLDGEATDGRWRLRLSVVIPFWQTLGDPLTRRISAPQSSNMYLSTKADVVL